MSRKLAAVAKAMGMNERTALAAGRCLRELRALDRNDRLEAITVIVKCHCEPDLRAVAFRGAER